MEQRRTASADQSETDPKAPVVEIFVAFIAGFTAFLTTQVTATIAVAGTIPFEADEWIVDTVSMVGFGLGVIVFLLVYFSVSRHDWDFLDIRLPGVKGVGYIAGGTILLLAALFALSVLFAQLNVETAEHGTIAEAEGNPELLLLMIPVSLLIIGPGEEVLFRNIVQKRLYAVLEKPTAVIVASVLFAVIHLPAYYIPATGTTDLLTSIAVVFVLSILLGGIYAATENIVIPATIHGLYNAFVFGQAYFNQVGMIL